MVWGTHACLEVVSWLQPSLWRSCVLETRPPGSRPACLGFLTREGAQGLLCFPAPAGARTECYTTGRWLIPGGRLWGCELSLCP